ncbi:MAG: hypothetical protein HY000_26420 [Planctomycetes bacterium]|nr:hypothetical protein [Planctomycetota bacterium]
MDDTDRVPCFKFRDGTVWNRVRTVAALTRDSLDVAMEYGGTIRIASEFVPEECRVPNRCFWIIRELTTGKVTTVLPEEAVRVEELEARSRREYGESGPVVRI